MNFLRSVRLAALASLAGAAPRIALAATHRVDSIAALQAGLDAARPGDVILVRDGAYATSAPLTVACVGTDGAPITIAAESVGGVTLAGTHGFNVVTPAAHVEIRGFRLTHASGREVIGAGTQHVRFTRNTFLCTGAGAYLTVTGDDAEIDHNEFRDKHTLGNMISVTGTGSQVARRLRVHHNYFHDFANAHGNGAETIRFGLSGLSMSTGAGLVEYNLFVRCTGENELISNKSCGNTYRYNTFLESASAQLTLRHGNDCRVYGNILRGTDGIRIFGDRQQVFANYLEGNTLGINLGNGDGEVADGAKLTSHDRPDDAMIAFNTLVDNRTHYQMNGRTKGLGATHATFANNILQGGGLAAQIDGPNPGAVWSGNILWETAGAGQLPASGGTIANPKLVRGDDGLLRPAAGGPAGIVAFDGITALSLDAQGRPHPAEMSSPATAPTKSRAGARLLSPADVGPAAP